MRYSFLGNTSLKVSILSFGSLVIGPAQYRMPIARGQEILEYAWERGINFFDAAELYDTHAYLRVLAKREGAVISSRSYAYSREGMKESLDRARRELDADLVPIFGLHEQESGLTLKGHREALDYLVEARERGLIKAISVSTHYVQCVRAAAMLPEVDVIFAILNVGGLGIADGSRQDMEEALAFARYMGKGIYLMKALGGGHLHKNAYQALSYARDFPHKDSVCVGLKSEGEIDFAVRVMCGEDSEDLKALGGKLSSESKVLLVEDWCQGCGRCVEKCPFGAIRVENGVAVVDRTKCMLCGYCARVCPHFCLKVM